MGHELGGDIVEVGSDVTEVKVGDACAVYFYLTCHRCRWCRGGRETLCEAFKGFVGVHRDGGFAEYVSLPVENFLPIPKGLSYEAAAMATDAASAGLVDVAPLAKGVRLDMRYAGTANFTGARVPGYEANTCLLLAPVAQALAKVQADVQREGLSLKLFDCYRPVRSVKHFVAWARDAADQRTKPAFYPNVEKAALLDGYIAETSGHSRGATLEVRVATQLGMQVSSLQHWLSQATAEARALETAA